MGTRHVLLALGLGVAPMAVQAADEAAAPAAATRTAVAPGRDRTVVTGEHYGAGAVHRWLWGADYRDVWTTPARVEVLDLQSFAGGLAPLTRVGGQETKGLAFRGADGRDYTFRAVDKDPTAILPAELRDTWARDLVQDQIAANQPASALVVDELMRAAGILRTEQRLVVMPDDPALGAFRKDFAGVVGQVYEFPRARSASNPGFEGAVEILKHDALYERLARDSRDRVDARAFLKARLLDIMVGDWDRHRDQWRWARFEDTPGWQPIPDDRDQAFSRYDGLVMALSRARVPILQSYGDDYPSMKGLTWNGWEQDRELLAGLERSVWMDVSAELRSEITDDVIQRAARRMPAEYFQIDGARLIRDLTARRDRLDKGASAFYEHLADKVKVYLTDGSEDVEIRRLDGGDVRVEAWARDAEGTRKAEPFYRRTLHENETEEVQVYTRGGTDRIVTLGRPRGIQVHVVGGSGQATVDDRRGGGTTLSDSGRGELQAGPGSRLDRRPYAAPAGPRNAPWIPPRDWGRNTFVTPWLSYGSDAGAVLGAVVDTQSFGFRKDPYSSRHVVRAAWSFGESTYRTDYRADFRPQNRAWSWGWYALASGIESSRFFGFGNETTDTAGPKEFYKAKDRQFAFTPALTVPLWRDLSLSAGPTIKYSSSIHTEDATLINQAQPYGFGDFGEVGATARLELDTRDAARRPGGVALRNFGYPRSGTHLTVKGQVFPGAWDVEETFGSVHASAATYLTPGFDRAPTLALRAGGAKVFGTHPYFESAYLGGGTNGLDAVGGSELLRGAERQRYAGDESVFGSADLRIYVSRFRIILPGTWGLLAFGDVGRVYLQGEESDEWHPGYGGGLWFAWLDRANTLTATFARSEGKNAVYVRAGFAF